MANHNFEVFMNTDRQPKQITPRVRKLPADPRGNILVYLVVVILIFGVLGVSLVSLFTTATGSSATPNDAKRARFIAESGIRYALSEIRNSDDIEETATNLNTTIEFKLGTNGGFTANVFTPGLELASGGAFGPPYYRLTVPYSGIFPMDFDIHTAASEVYIVDWLRFTGAPPPSNSYTKIANFPPSDPGGAADVLIFMDDDYQVNLGDTVCFSLLVTVDDTRIERGDDIFVNDKASEFFPPQNGAIRITQNDGKLYDYFYETREDPSGGNVRLTNLREIPPGDWEDITNLQTVDFVTLSPFNFRLFASGTSDQITVEVGSKRPFWAMNMPGRRGITMDDVLEDHNIVGEGDVFNPQAIGDKKIEIGKDSDTDPEGFGDLWYSGTETIGGQKNYCSEGRCLFDKGVRVFFTTEFIPRSNGGEGFTFALLAAGETLVLPVNTKDSGGGDYQLPELLAYAGSSLQSDATFADGSGDGLMPPKLALEFDTRTNFNTPLDYCSGGVPDNLVAGSRNDPLPGGTEKDVLQYVFWGSDDPTDLNLSCRSAAIASYDDNRHDAEGDQVAENFRYSVGVPIRSEPTYDPTDGTLYFTSDYSSSQSADVFAINTEDGTLKWKYNAAGRDITSKPALDTIGAERFVYFSAADDLYKLRADPPGTTGISVWLRNIDDFFDKVSPVVDNNNHKIYIGSRTSERFYAYNSDGVRLWLKDLGEDIEATAVIDKTGGPLDGNVYVGTADDNSEPDGRVYGFDPDAPPPDPAPVWPYFITDNDVSSRPTLSQDGSELYVVTDNGNAYAIFTASGAQKWSNTSDIGGVNYIDTAVSPLDGTLYIATDIGVLHAIDPANGNEKWQKSLVSGITYSSPAVGPDGTIYIGTNGNRVFAINPDSSTKWVFFTPGLADVRSTPEVGGDGVVYVGDNDGNLYALANVAVPRNFRNAYASGQRGNLTSADLDATVEVDDTDKWLAGKPLTKGPWAVRTEIVRSLSVNGNSKYDYTLRTWVRQCANFDCSDIIGTLFENTAGDYDHTPLTPNNLPFEQTIELTQGEHDDFTRFLFGFTTAAGDTDDQTVDIRDFKLDFRLTGDTPLGADPDWP